MRRVAVVALFLAAALSPAAAFASSKWSAVSTSTANRFGYTSPCPEAFRAHLVSAVGAFVGPTFDGTGTVNAWSQTAESSGSGNVDFSPAESKDGGTLFTPIAGQDFALLVYLGHYKDWQLSTPAGGSGQFMLPRINNTNVFGGSFSAANMKREAVLGNESDPYGGYGIAVYGSTGLAAQEASPTMPSSKWQTVRSFVTYAGKWDAGASAWRVRTRVWIDDGSRARVGYSKETTYTSLVLQTYMGIRPDGYIVEKSYNASGKRQVTRRQEAGISATNVEFWEAAVTTDTAEVARVYDKAVTQSAVDAEPSSYWETPPDIDDEDGSGFPLNIGGWKNWIAENVTGPVSDAFDGLADLLWFVEPAKEWFGLGD